MGILKSKTADFSKMTLTLADASGAQIKFGAAGLQGWAFGPDGKLTPQGLTDAATVLGKMRLEVKVSAKATAVGSDKATGAGGAAGITVEASDAARNYGADYGVRPSEAALFTLREQERKAREAQEARLREEREEQDRRLAALKAQAEEEERAEAQRKASAEVKVEEVAETAGANGRRRK